MGNDPRVRYTRGVIQTAFLDLLRQKPVEKITVREICDKAEINRSTFYKHYQDCYDLLDKIKEDVLRQFDEMLSGMKAQGVKATMTAILQMLKDNAALFRVFRRQGGERSFINQLAGRCFEYMDMQISVPPALGWGDAQKGMVCSYLTGGAAAIIEYWLQTGCEEPPEQIADMTLELSKILTAGLAGQ